MSEHNSRRQFLKKSLFIAGALAVVNSFSKTAVAEERRRARPDDSGAGGGAGKPDMVKPGEGMAASVNYVENWKSVKDEKFKIARQGVAWGKQRCEVCALYTKNDTTTGKCTLFAGKLVKAQGVCGSWSKKA